MSEVSRASRAVWEAMAPGWDDRHAYFEEVARPVAERLLGHLRPEPGNAVLELAAGTGLVGLAAATLVGPGGRVILSDFSPAMVEVARRRVDELGLANVECRVLDAEQLDLPDGAVDGVLCRWGYMLMPDPARALAETRRVLRPGGRVSCAVFSAPAENPWAALPSQVLQERGHIRPGGSGAPGIFALADPDRLRRLGADAGFTDPQIEPVPFTLPFDGFDDYWAFVVDAAGAISTVLSKLDDDERQRVRRLVAERAADFATGDGLELPAVSLVVSAS